MIRGSILWLSLSLVLFFVFTGIEYLGQFSTPVRKGLFYAALTLITAGFSWQVFRPMLILWSRPLLKDEVRIARFLARHFPSIDDQIINTLQLGRSAQKDQELIAAAVKQKVARLKPIPFAKAITYGENLRLLPYLLIPVSVALILLSFEGGQAFIRSSDRIIRYSENFIPPAPFRFIIENDSLQLEKGQALDLKVRLEGEAVPGRLLIDDGQQELAMVKVGLGSFHYKMEGLTENRVFQLVAGPYRSETFEIEVVPVPSLQEISWEVRPPAYTGLSRQRGRALEPLLVPEGSELLWRLSAVEAQAYILESNLFDSIRADGQFHWTAQKDLQYQFFLKNQYKKAAATNRARVEVQADQRPLIKARFFADSTNPQRLFIDWQGEDDYGLKRLDYLISTKEGKEQVVAQTGLDKVVAGSSRVLLLDTLDLKAGVDYQVFLKLWDNDGINGSKFTQSQKYRFRNYSEEEKEERLQQSLAQSQENARRSKKARQELSERFRDLENDFKRKSKLDWQDQQKLKELIKDLEQINKEDQKKKEALKKQLNEAAKDSSSAENERLKEMTKEESELERLKEEIQSLLEELNKEKLEEKLEELRKENKAALRKEERQESLLEDLRFQREVLQKAKELSDLAKAQEELSKQEGADESKEQAGLNEQKKDLEQELKESAKEFKELQELLSKESFKKASEQAEQAMQKAQEQGKQKPGSENQAQQEASESLQEMSDQMQSLMAQMQSQAMQQNAESLRQILDNLEIFSHDVEEAGKEIAALDQNDPAFRVLLQEQNRLSRGLVVINDSLKALSERTPQVKEAVFEHLEEMNDQMARGKAELQETRTNRAAAAHQFAMMEANELALMLDESLQNMRQMMAMQKPGKQNCQKPGGGKPSAGKPGKKVDKQGPKAGKKPGDLPGRDGRGMSGKQLVEIISRQEQLRNELQRMMEEQGESPGLNKSMEELEDLERELLQEGGSDDYLERIKAIESRMLESEKAEEKRKQKDERQSKTAEPIEQLFRESMEHYLRENRPVDERLYRRTLRLKPFYQKRKLKDAK